MAGPRNAHPTDIQLADGADRNEMLFLIQHEEFQAPDTSPNWYALLLSGNAVRGRRHGGLGRPVVVPYTGHAS